MAVGLKVVLVRLWGLKHPPIHLVRNDCVGPKGDGLLGSWSAGRGRHTCYERFDA